MPGPVRCEVELLLQCKHSRAAIRENPIATELPLEAYGSVCLDQTLLLLLLLARVGGSGTKLLLLLLARVGGSGTRLLNLH